jgi:hypothetical protein
MRRVHCLRALGWLLLMLGHVAVACPLCSTDRGVRVRAAIFNDHFLSTLGLALAPFGVLAVVVVGLQWIWKEAEVY